MKENTSYDHGTFLAMERFTAPWPLYKLHILAKNLKATVVFFEGEKASDVVLNYFHFQIM